MDSKRREEKKEKQPPRTDDASKGRVQEPGQVDHPERHGDADRQPEEPHGESEAV